MPEGNAAAAAGQEEPQGQTSMMSRMLQMGAMYFGMQLLMKQFLPKQDAATTTATTTDASGNVVKVPVSTGAIPAYHARPDRLDEGATYNPTPQRLAAIWPEDSKLDIVIAVSPTHQARPLNAADSDPVVLSEKAFGLGDFKDKRSIDTTIQVPKQVQNNGTLWGHFFIGLAGAELDPYSPSYDRAAAYCFAFPLTQYIVKKKAFKTRNLLAGKDGAGAEAGEVEAEVEEDTAPGPIVASYYHPNTSLSFVPSSGIIDYPNTAPAIQQFVHPEATGARDGSGQNSWYYPVLFVNTFWQLKTHMTLLNDTVTTLPMHLDLGNLNDWQFKLMASIEMSGRESARQAAWGNQLPGGGDGTEIEMVKEIVLDTNPYLLAVTVIVTVAHLILEMLAFGSDISHYRKKKDNVGISVRSILANVFMQTVIFLYLIDNSQNTSWMILGSQGVGIVIELWKITTVVDVRVRDAPPGSLLPYRIAFEDKHKLTETEEKTKEYDEIAFKYMYVAAVPLLLAYAVYSLVYDTHKSWYSYVIATLVGSVYAYGFLMMVPSLYINYRLKSVAHMPGKAMMYKFVNTFIDDLFAFTIKMPFLHRLATFRDDIIFFIYLYQRWAYRVDYTRVNEFGQGGDDGDAAEAETTTTAPQPKLVTAADKKTGTETAALPAAEASAKTSGTDAKAGSATKKRK
ncbi:hypothetical protein HMPREF1624_08128 [Sporothrix schenckii ATCC 58251]|uniref:Cleft lip and palate transmembrane protein 1 n=1 Tax=Sporothrix schenckii (strain ATCC 58251 / de Perez 2211183) TaxID=1391915 RepID=U7PJ99_SPOS1|nr:hypothetical protein HMPREF1624_08128 [Sporothrix schenckii ATCC 58251]